MFLSNLGSRYSYESLSSIPPNPHCFTERYLDVKKVLVDTFYGPPTQGVYSPSVQSTLYQVARNVLNRSLSQSPSHTHPSTHIDSHSTFHTHTHTHISACSHVHTGRKLEKCMDVYSCIVCWHWCMHDPLILSLGHVWLLQLCNSSRLIFFFLSNASRFLDISSVELKMPNIHFLPVNLKNKDNETIVKVGLSFISYVCQRLLEE